MSETIVGIVTTGLGIGFLLWSISKINYVVDESFLRIRVGPITLRKFAIEEIRDIQPGYRHWSENWTNTIYLPTIRKRAVTIYRKSGRFSRINITPHDPAAFVETVKTHPLFRSSASRATRQKPEMPYPDD